LALDNSCVGTKEHPVMKKRVGFVGLGHMGKPMAKRLVSQGFDVTVYDIRKEPMCELEKHGAKPARSLEEVSKASDIVITMVLDDVQTEKVVLDKGGILEGMPSGATIIIMSTISPLTCQKIAQEAEQKGVSVLDAPVSGSVVGAEAGTLSIVVGGTQKTLEDCRPILEALGKNLFHLGDVGMGLVAKLVNNLMLNIHMLAAFEGLVLGVRAGIKVENLLAVIKSGTGNCWTIQNWDGVVAQVEAMQAKRIPDIMRKDTWLALSVAKDLGLQLPVTALASQLDHKLQTLLGDIQRKGTRETQV
jgi:3-hydroxyisobutyrate dehydrogenase-like beta-hydroxyacid dehydrogenase